MRSLAMRVRHLRLSVTIACCLCLSMPTNGGPTTEEGATASGILMMTRLIQLMEGHKSATRSHLHCIVLYGLDTFEFDSKVSFGGFVTAESNKSASDLLPMCPGFLAKFDSLEEAKIFSSDEQLSRLYLSSKSLAVVTIKEPVSSQDDLALLINSGSFERTTKLAILAKVTLMKR